MATLDDLLRFVAYPPPGDLSLTATNDQMSVSVANRSPLATTGSVLGLATLYPEDYATGGYIPGSGGDDTPAMQALFDDAATKISAATINQGFAIRLPPILNLNSAPRTDRDGNAILAFPTVGAPSRAALWELIAAPGGTTIYSNQAGKTYSALHGPPSMIGGPTDEGAGGTGAAFFNNVSLVITGDLSIKTPDAGMSGLDLSHVPFLRFDKLFPAGPATAGGAQPGAPAFGVRLPGVQNSGQVTGQAIIAQGLHAGVVLNEHATVDYVFSAVCVGGLCFDGIPPTHAAQIGRVFTGSCKYHIAGWSGATGVESLPNSTESPLQVGLWSIEEGTGWTVTTSHVLDANNQLRAYMPWVREGNSAVEPTMNGGAFVGLVDAMSGAGGIRFAVGGTEAFRYYSNQISLGPNFLTFGSSAGSADITIARQGAGVLEVQNGALNALQTLLAAVKVKAGAPVDGDFPGAVDGLIVVDTTNNKIWARTGGAWKGVAIA